MNSSGFEPIHTDYNALNSRSLDLLGIGHTKLMAVSANSKLSRSWYDKFVPFTYFLLIIKFLSLLILKTFKF